jgi:hypothetical protein
MLFYISANRSRVAPSFMVGVTFYVTIKLQTAVVNFELLVGQNYQRYYTENFNT